LLIANKKLVYQNEEKEKRADELEAQVKQHTADLLKTNRKLQHEISERKRTEEEILKSKNFSETLLESIPLPVFYKDINGRYLGFNKAYEDFYGKTKEELIGKSVFDIRPDALARIYHAEDVELFEQLGTQTYESKDEDAQGIIHDVVFHKAVITNSLGKVTGLIGTILDISERRQAEVAMRDRSGIFSPIRP